MKNTLLSTAFGLLCALAPLQAAWALATDRDQPMNIEADALRHDDAKQVTVFTGNVVVTKGSIVLRGETLTVRQAANGTQSGSMEAGKGKRAFFSQQRDTPAGAPKETVQGQAQTVTYDGNTDKVRLVGQGELRRYRGNALADEITGSVIEYNNRTGFFSVDGKAQSGDKGNAGSAGGNRVRAVIGADSAGSKGGGANSKPAAKPANLQPSATLEQSPH